MRNGNLPIRMSLSDHVPCFLRVDQSDCRVWYAGQLIQCSICRSSGHRAPTCPLSGLCRCCRQPGHMARECMQGWGPSVSNPSPDMSSEPSASSDHAMADASRAVTDSVPVCSASGSDPTAPVPVSYCPCHCAYCSCFCCCSRYCLCRSCLCRRCPNHCFYCYILPSSRCPSSACMFLLSKQISSLFLSILAILKLLRKS